RVLRERAGADGGDRQPRGRGDRQRAALRGEPPAGPGALGPPRVVAGRHGPARAGGADRRDPRPGGARARRPQHGRRAPRRGAARVRGRAPARGRRARRAAPAPRQLRGTDKLRALGESASGVAHDFNNLLASIRGRAQLVLQRVQNPQLRQWLQVIERAALDGAQTVRRLQEFTRIRRDEPFVAVDLNEVVREALEITQSRWRDEAVSRGVSLEVRNDLAVLPKVAGDPVELREALTNLILNAVDAMPDGGVLTLTTAVGPGEIVVTVSDTGVGIPTTIRDRIFDPFFT